MFLLEVPPADAAVASAALKDTVQQLWVRMAHNPFFSSST